MLDKIASNHSGGQTPESVWIDPQGYKAAVAEREHAFETELAKQEK